MENVNADVMGNCKSTAGQEIVEPKRSSRSGQSDHDETGKYVPQRAASAPPRAADFF